MISIKITASRMILFFHFYHFNLSSHDSLSTFLPSNLQNFQNQERVRLMTIMRLMSGKH